LSEKVALLVTLFSFVPWLEAQSTAPYVYQVLPYATVQQSGPYAGTIASKSACTSAGCTPGNAAMSGKFTPQPPVYTLNSVLNVSVATALSVIPLASPASGVITKFDPSTGAELPASSSLGPIFTERAETIGRHKFYVGISTEQFHFTSFNGQSTRPGLQLLDTGGQATTVNINGINSSPALTYTMSTDVRVSQNMALLTFGVTSRFDVSVGLPVVHTAISAGGYTVAIYGGNGLGMEGNHCWCQGTLTPNISPLTPNNPNSLLLPQANFDALGKTGFGDMLLRFKGTVMERSKMALALGADLRLPTGDDRNLLGTGTTSVKPFAALSLYTQPWSNGIVFSPHVNVGWQFAGQSILAGQLAPTTKIVRATLDGTTYPPTAVYAPPFTATQGYLPDVFSWAVGSEVALGKRNTIVLDIIGNQIGWIHGISNMTTSSKRNVLSPVPPNQTETISGFVNAGRVSFGEYNGAFGYKGRIVGNLVGTANVLVRLDNNGLVARAVPLFGLSYTF
jgi:hypothetical protein